MNAGKLIGIASFILCFLCCTDEKESDRDIISVSPASITTQGGTETVQVSASCLWKADADVDWVHISPTEGDGDMSVSISIDKDTVTAIANVIFRTGNKEVVNGEYNEEYISKVNGEVSDVSYGRIASLRITRNRTLHSSTDTLPPSPSDSTKPSYPVYTPKPIDLGLSVKWASFNLGAQSPEQFGYYYDHGALEPYKTVYTYNAMFENGHLKPEFDVVTQSLGEDWRLPTWAEFVELSNSLKWKNYYLDGVYGFLGTAKNDSTIFFPAAGFLANGAHRDTTRGLYLTSKRYAAPTMLFVKASDREGANNDQHEWRSVRAVYVGK